MVSSTVAVVTTCGQGQRLLARHLFPRCQTTWIHEAPSSLLGRPESRRSEAPVNSAAMSHYDYNKLQHLKIRFEPSRTRVRQLCAPLLSVTGASNSCGFRFCCRVSSSTQWSAVWQRSRSHSKWKLWPCTTTALPSTCGAEEQAACCSTIRYALWRSQVGLYGVTVAANCSPVTEANAA